MSNKIEVAFIFGSMARGTETAGSDVDLLIVGTADFGAVIDALHVAQEQLSRDINPKVFSAIEWNVKSRQKNPFVLELMGMPKIFLLGTENDLTELGRY